jgi:hypothetical protein
MSFETITTAISKSSLFSVTHKATFEIDDTTGQRKIDPITKIELPTRIEYVVSVHAAEPDGLEGWINTDKGVGAVVLYTMMIAGLERGGPVAHFPDHRAGILSYSPITVRSQDRKALPDIAAQAGQRLASAVLGPSVVGSLMAQHKIKVAAGIAVRKAEAA